MTRWRRWRWATRWYHRLYAWFTNRYFLPCPICHEPFGGHETYQGLQKSIPDPAYPEDILVFPCEHGSFHVPVGDLLPGNGAIFLHGNKEPRARRILIVCPACTQENTPDRYWKKALNEPT